MEGNAQIDVTQCDEAMLYFRIDSLGYVMWWQRHNEADGRVPPAEPKWYEKTQADLEAAVDQTTRFGVSKPRADGGPTEEYWLWFRWWDAWKRGMDDEEWREVDAKISAGLSAELRPQGDWKVAEVPNA